MGIRLEEGTFAEYRHSESLPTFYERKVVIIINKYHSAVIRQDQVGQEHVVWL